MKSDWPRTYNQLALSPEEQFKNRLILQSIWQQRSTRTYLQRWEVVIPNHLLLKQCGEEYPNGWVGKEVDYIATQRLVLLAFTKPFLGLRLRSRRLETKTREKSGHDFTIWTPDWLLVEVRNV